MELLELIRILRKLELTIAFAESVTAGMAVHEFSMEMDIGRILLGGIIAYKETCKTGVLKVKKSTIDKNTSESQEVTNEMAKGLDKLFQAGVVVAVTGLASPGGSETKQKPVGTIFVSVLYKKNVHEFKSRFYGSQEEIVRQAVNMMYSKTSEVLNKES